MNYYQRTFWSIILKFLPGGSRKKTEFIRKYSESTRELYGIDKMPCMNHALASKMYENFLKARAK